MVEIKTIKLPSKLYLGTRFYKHYDTKKLYTDSIVFIIPVEKGSKRYDTVDKWSLKKDPEYYAPQQHGGEVKEIDCIPAKGYERDGITNRSESTSKIDIKIPNIGIVEISLQNYLNIVDELEDLGKKFKETEMIYDGKELNITEGKDIIYSGVSLNNVIEGKEKSKLKKLSNPPKFNVEIKGNNSNVDKIEYKSEVKGMSDILGDRSYFVIDSIFKEYKADKYFKFGMKLKEGVSSSMLIGKIMFYTDKDGKNIYSPMLNFNDTDYDDKYTGMNLVSIDVNGKRYNIVEDIKGYSTCKATLLNYTELEDVILENGKNYQINGEEREAFYKGKKFTMGFVIDPNEPKFIKKEIELEFDTYSEKEIKSILEKVLIKISEKIEDQNKHIEELKIEDPYNFIKCAMHDVKKEEDNKEFVEKILKTL